MSSEKRALLGTITTTYLICADNLALYTSSNLQTKESLTDNLS